MDKFYLCKNIFINISFNRLNVLKVCVFSGIVSWLQVLNIGKNIKNIIHLVFSLSSAPDTQVWFGNNIRVV
jgi:hypothetical protein